jgi:hypothetical protein
MKCSFCFPTKYNAFSGFPPMTPWQNYDSISFYKTFKYFFSGPFNPSRLNRIIPTENLLLLHFEQTNYSDLEAQLHFIF